MKYKVLLLNDINDYGCVFETEDYWDAVIWCDSVLYATCRYNLMAELNTLQQALNRSKYTQIPDKKLFPYEVINLCLRPYNLKLEEKND